MTNKSIKQTLVPLCRKGRSSYVNVAWMKWFVWFMIAGLAGCAVGPDYQKPDLSIPAN